MKPSRRGRREQRRTEQRDEILYCSMRVCQDSTPKVVAVNTIILTDPVTGERLFRHRCAEHTHPLHVKVASS